METKFTKGEWIITTPTSKTEPQRIATTAIQENPNKAPYICDMWGMATDEGKANAKLLCAAPDMLTVLLELQESASYWSEYDVPIGIVERINSAIDKAVGSVSF